MVRNPGLARQFMGVDELPEAAARQPLEDRRLDPPRWVLRVGVVIAGLIVMLSGSMPWGLLAGGDHLARHRQRYVDRVSSGQARAVEPPTDPRLPSQSPRARGRVRRA